MTSEQMAEALGDLHATHLRLKDMLKTIINSNGANSDDLEAVASGADDVQRMARLVKEAARIARTNTRQHPR